MKPHTYLKTLVLSFMLGAIFLAAFNYLSDPLFLFHYEKVTKDAAGYDRQYKPWHIRQKQPELVVIGNSRTDFSIDVTQFNIKPAYNFSLQGAGLSDMLTMMKHLTYATKVKTAYVVVENICSQPVSSSINMQQFAANDATNWSAHTARLKYLFDIDNLRKGLTHLLMSDKIYYDPNGKRLDWITDNETITQRTKKRESRTILNGSKVDTAQCKTDDFEQLLRLAYKNNIALSILINPVNLRYLEIINQFENLKFHLKLNKELMVGSINKVATEQSQPAFPIYDFLLVNDITAEPFDLINNTETMYWWESSHYKDNVGEKMVEWIMSSVDNRDTTFARQLTKDNVVSHNKKQQALFMHWRAKNPDIVKEISGDVLRLIK